MMEEEERLKPSQAQPYGYEVLATSFLCASVHEGGWPATAFSLAAW